MGRKQVQPSKKELRAFYSQAEERLEYPTLWFDERARLVIASAFEQVCKEHRYTAWACAVLQNHAHLLLRTHRDKAELMWENVAVAARNALWDVRWVERGHPVWSNRPFVKFKTSVPVVRTCVKYIEDNPEKHNLPRQVYPWVVEYDGFPFHKKHK
jgi:REP element-mobilizing transposase RayT